MCDICNEQSKEIAKEGLNHLAKRLRNFARDMERLADGDLQPHSVHAGHLVTEARILVKDLAEWI